MDSSHHQKSTDSGENADSSTSGGVSTSIETSNTTQSASIATSKVAEVEDETVDSSSQSCKADPAAPSTRGDDARINRVRLHSQIRSAFHFPIWRKLILKKEKIYSFHYQIFISPAIIPGFFVFHVFRPNFRGQVGKGRLQHALSLRRDPDRDPQRCDLDRKQPQPIGSPPGLHHPLSQGGARKGEC